MEFSSKSLPDLASTDVPMEISSKSTPPPAKISSQSTPPLPQAETPSHSTPPPTETSSQYTPPSPAEIPSQSALPPPPPLTETSSQTAPTPPAEISSEPAPLPPPPADISSQNAPLPPPYETPSQSTPLQTETSSQSTPPPTTATAAETSSQNAPAPTETPSQSTPTDSEPTSPVLSRKRRRRKKQFPGMIPSSRSLRPQSSRPSVIYNEKLLDRLLDSHLPSPSSRRRNRANDLATESLIAAAVGFPIDSLTEEEIESNVIPIIGNAQSQSNYITIRNHILTLFRSDPSAFLTETQSAASIRAEHRALVSKAYDFLNSHAYINFGLLPVPKAPAFDAAVVIIGAGLAGGGVMLEDEGGGR